MFPDSQSSLLSGPWWWAFSAQLRNLGFEPVSFSQPLELTNSENIPSGSPWGGAWEALWGPLLSLHSSCRSYSPLLATPCPFTLPLTFPWFMPSFQGPALCPLSKPSLRPHPPAGPGYAPLREEAVRLFLALQALEGARRPGPLMQGVLQTCRDLPALRDELFLQLAKQTSGPAGPPGPQLPKTLRPFGTGSFSPV